MTATMDVDSDDDDEIIAERGTIAHILIFSRRARVCILLSLSRHFRRPTKGKAAIFLESENNGQQHFWAKRNSNALLSSKEL
jgi:hypothetical protein